MIESTTSIAIKIKCDVCGRSWIGLEKFENKGTLINLETALDTREAAEGLLDSIDWIELDDVILCDKCQGKDV